MRLYPLRHIPAEPCLKGYRAVCIVCRDNKLTHAGIIKMLEFILDCRKTRFIIVKRNRIIHKRMNRPCKTAFCRSPCVYHPFYILQFVFRIRLSPLLIVIRVVFRRKNINIHLKIAAELHQADPVFHRPRNTIISFNKTTVLADRIIFHLKLADRISLRLL